VKLDGNNSNSSIGKIFQNVIDERIIFLPCPKEIFIKPIFIDEMFKSSWRSINSVIMEKNNATHLKNLNGEKLNLYSMISEFASKNNKKLRIITIPRFIVVFLIKFFGFFHFKIGQIESIRNLLFVSNNK
jgi:hypothetical protein